MHPLGDQEDLQNFLPEPKGLRPSQHYSAVGWNLVPEIKEWNKKYPQGPIPLPDANSDWATHQAGGPSLTHHLQDMHDRQQQGAGSGADTPSETTPRRDDVPPGMEDQIHGRRMTPEAIRPVNNEKTKAQALLRASLQGVPKQADMDKEVVKWGPGPRWGPKTLTQEDRAEHRWGSHPCGVNDPANPNFKTVWKHRKCWLPAGHIGDLTLCPGCWGWFCKEHIGQREHICHGKILEKYNLQGTRLEDAQGNTYPDVARYFCPMIQAAIQLDNSDGAGNAHTWDTSGVWNKNVCRHFVRQYWCRNILANRGENTCAHNHALPCNLRGTKAFPLIYDRYSVRGPDPRQYCPYCICKGHANAISTDCPYTEEEQVVVRSMIHAGFLPPKPGFLTQWWESGRGRPPCPELYRAARLHWGEMVEIWGHILELRRYHKIGQDGALLEYAQDPEGTYPWWGWRKEVVTIPPGHHTRLAQNVVVRDYLQPLAIEGGNLLRTDAGPHFRHGVHRTRRG